MSFREGIKSRIAAPDAKRQKLLDEILDVLDSNDPVATLDAVEVLTMLLATLIVVGAHKRQTAELLVKSATWNMNDMIEREEWPEEQPEQRRH